jgi:uncharacterized protein
MLASEWPAPAAPELVRQWLGQQSDLSRVNAPAKTARAIARAWTELTGGTTTCSMAQGMHVLREVRDPPHPATGALRLASVEDRSLLVDWMRTFIEEVGLTGAERAEAMVDAHLARGSLLVWEDGGVVSMLGHGRAVADVVRIGPVYTPPQARRRGYAGSAVAAASRRALASGARACMLFTDLANPTSNKVYAEVGYERAGRWEEHAFAPA